MTFRFQEGDKVVLKDPESHSRFLQAGSRGVVFCQYATTPPAYEVTFEGIEGRQVGTIAYEDEIEAVAEALSLSAGRHESIGATS